MVNETGTYLKSGEIVQTPKPIWMFILFKHGGVMVHLTLILVVEFRNVPKPSLRVINTK